MNARTAITKRAQESGWNLIVTDGDGEIWGRGQERFVVRYKMFGNPTNPLMRYYGKSQADGINWGVDTAFFGEDPVVGKDKKRQILRRLR